MRISDEGLELVRYFEGFRELAYKCPGGVWTIGYGSTRGVQAGDRITADEAEARLLGELYEFGAGVVSAVSAPTSEAELSALVSFAFNVGLGAFRASSVLRFHELGQKRDAADAFGLWIQSGGEILRGLQLRRYAEAELYLTGRWTRPGVPRSAVALATPELRKIEPIDALQAPPRVNMRPVGMISPQPERTREELLEDPRNG